MLFRVQSLWTWLFSILTVLPQIEPVLEPSSTPSFQPSPIQPIHFITLPTPPPRQYPYPPIIKRDVVVVDVTTTRYTSDPVEVVTTWSESTSYLTMQQPDDGGMPSTTITSEVIKVVVTPLPESGGLALGDKIALGVGIPAAVFGGLGLFKWCF